MTAPERSPGSSARPPLVPPSALGFPTILLMVWIVLEFCRPPNPLKIPLMISITLFLAWLLDGRKVFTPQVKLCFLFVAIMVISTPFAANNFDAFHTMRVTATVIVFIAIPLGHFVDSLRRFDALLRTWIASLFYMAVVAVFSGGMGPGGARAGVDENYTALFLSMGIGFSFFLVPVTKSAWGKLALLMVIGFSCAGIVAGFSRGGFLGMAAVGVFCWWRSPHKLPAFVIAILLAGSVFMAAPDHYWDEVRSIGDTEEGTASARITLWKVATHMYLDNPIFGVGPGNYPWNYYEYRTQILAERYNAVIGMPVTHSFYFELIAEMGTAGLMLIAGLIYFNWRDLGLVKRIVKAQRELVTKSQSRLSARDRADHLARMARSQAYGNGLTAAFLGFFVGSAFVSTLYYTTFWILTAVTMALRLSVTNEARDFAQRIEATQAPPGPPPRSSVASVAATPSPNSDRTSVSTRRGR